MSKYHYDWRSAAIKNYYPMPNDLFNLGLSSSEIAIYSYLVRSENRQTHQCYPSYKTIGEAVGLTPNTVKKYAGSLCERRLITTEHTEVITKAGEKRNGTLLYTILPMAEAIRYHYEQQFHAAEVEQNRQRVKERVEASGQDCLFED